MGLPGFREPTDYEYDTINSLDFSPGEKSGLEPTGEPSMSEKVSVDPMDANKNNSPVSSPESDEATVMLDNAASKCAWNGQEFDEGQLVDCQGEVYECSYGQWVKQG